MAGRNTTLNNAQQGEENTANNPELSLLSRIVLPIVRLNPLFLTPLIVLSIAPDALFQQQLILLSAIPVIGITGMVTARRFLVIFVYTSLLLLTVWGKVAGDIYSLPAPDSALFLAEFMIIIFLMEASLRTLNFETVQRQLKNKTDDLSLATRVQVNIWLVKQISNLSQLTLAGFGLALGLVLVGTVVSVSFNQLAFSGALVLAVVVVLMLLLTYRREPEVRERSSTVS